MKTAFALTAALAALAWCVGRALAHHSPGLRYGLYLVIFFAMAACIPVSFALITRNVAVDNASTNRSIASDVSQTMPLRTDLQGETVAASGVVPSPSTPALGRFSRHLTLAYTAGVLWMLVRLIGAVRGGQRLALYSEPIDDEIAQAVAGAPGRCAVVGLRLWTLIRSRWETRLPALS